MAKSDKTSTKNRKRRSESTANTRAPEELSATAVVLHQVGAKAQAPKAAGAKKTNTIIYVHGIGNKPVASVLKCQWDNALFGTRLGDRSRMAYWVNRDYYPRPLDESCATGDVVKIEDDEASTRAIMAVASGQKGDNQLTLSNEISALTSDAKRQLCLTQIAEKLMNRATAPNVDGLAARDIRAKVFPLPEFLRRLIARNLTRAFLRDVNDFMFVKERRAAMEQSLIDRISAGGGPFVVIGHSQGSMIAYDVLRQLNRAQCHVPLFVTIGSPLGLQEVQDALREWTGGTLPFPSCVDRWLNVADPLDPVAFDKDISDDFEGKIENDIEFNLDSPQHPHSGTGYLRTNSVQAALRDALGTAFSQAIAPFAIAKDLVADLEDGLRSQRHATLIQLSQSKPGDPARPKDLEKVAANVELKISEILVATNQNPKDANLERLRHYVAADLTRLEVETLRSVFSELKIDGIWRNASKRAFISESTHTVQARPANLGYGADGNGICWAVLDTGICADHPHFAKHKNVVAQWDCTKRGDPPRLTSRTTHFAKLDGNGHGTHVAGIIAGENDLEIDEGNNSGGTNVKFAGMAPRCTLYGFKVLDDNGNGRDSWIIKALDLISSMNESSGQLVIHGVNLSLGGNFDPSIFGTGHTPLCDELRRLWRQGVLVCLAAGNEGYAVLTGAEGGGPIQANLDLSIGDPANLEEAIAVGSVHKTNPHTYGISYFSSRGPTADGRRKPDVVAPGERILSANYNWTEQRNASAGPSPYQGLYAEMSGTSMATPHVSGVLAAFLSHRREFIGYPDRVKEILLAGCVDLRRDPYAQGAGLPNLIKMLALN
ncbi:S8 family serine peptidase [Methylocystis sp. H62]|uniref:S8 family serine peptidase n=1 Tax=Methylocystis sp. H62 TaxID=2785789 RepID=UPI0018C1EA66|nr:S8 family serine peptidase [Methylocystis sp. H62]MBG0792349.1 S8 family serine peptidase [Methylocystis sp. H62]